MKENKCVDSYVSSMTFVKACDAPGPHEELFFMIYTCVCMRTRKHEIFLSSSICIFLGINQTIFVINRLLFSKKFIKKFGIRFIKLKNNSTKIPEYKIQNFIPKLLLQLVRVFLYLNMNH